MTQVTHPRFGTGEILGETSNYVKVYFGESVRKFTKKYCDLYNIDGTRYKNTSNVKNGRSVKTGKESGLTLNDCVNLMKGRVYQCRKAGMDIYEAGYYKRGRRFILPLEGQPSNMDIFYLNEEGLIETLCCDTTKHRAEVLLDALLTGSINSVEESVINNYATNGYNTRRGLFADVNDEKLERIKKIARSHSDYMGMESGDSKADHEARVFLRN